VRHQDRGALRVDHLHDQALCRRTEVIWSLITGIMPLGGHSRLWGPRHRALVPRSGAERLPEPTSTAEQADGQAFYTSPPCAEMRVHAMSGGVAQASQRSGAAPVSGHAEPHRPGLSALRSWRRSLTGCGWQRLPTWPALRASPATAPNRLRCYLTWCAERGLDPLAAQRPHLELYIRWMEEVRRFRPLHRVPAVLRRGVVLPDLRPRRRAGALARRACPPRLSGPTRACFATRW